MFDAMLRMENVEEGGFPRLTEIVGTRTEFISINGLNKVTKSM